MRRSSPLRREWFFILLFGLVLALSAVPIATAQDATPESADHPLAGSWLLDTEVEVPDNPPALGYFGADGGYIEVDADGTNGLGAWVPTGASTADLTFSYVDEAGGITTVRASVEVAPDGQSLTASYTIEFLDPATGEWSGQIGPGTAEGTRIAVEAPGTPVGSFEDVFGAATPGATPGA